MYEGGGEACFICRLTGKFGGYIYGVAFLLCYTLWWDVNGQIKALCIMYCTLETVQ